MPTTCCVVNCGSRGDRDVVKFFKIPKELHFAHRVDLNELSKKRRQLWIQAIRRKDLTEIKLNYSRVCSKHFLSGKPSELAEENSPDWVPSLAMGYGKDEVVLKKVQMATEREERASKRKKCLLDDMSEVVPDQVPNEEGDITQLEDGTTENNMDKECQTNITAEDFTKIMISLGSIKKIEAKLGRVEWCFNFLKDNDVKTKYYTGLNKYQKLEILVKNLIDYVPVHFNTSLPVHDQVLLTMMKLRLNLDFKDLSYRFGISPTTASTYFKTIIEIIYERMKSFIVWPSREVLKTTMPTCFTDSFGTKISVIIDCFEIFIEKPSDLLRSAQCWSNYKHHHTVKYLIGITPQGTVCFE